MPHMHLLHTHTFGFATIHSMQNIFRFVCATARQRTVICSVWNEEREKTCWRSYSMKIDYFGPSALLISQVFFFISKTVEKTLSHSMIWCTDSFIQVNDLRQCPSCICLNYNEPNHCNGFFIRSFARSFAWSVVCFFASDLFLYFSFGSRLYSMSTANSVFHAVRFSILCLGFVFILLLFA